MALTRTRTGESSGPGPFLIVLSLAAVLSGLAGVVQIVQIAQNEPGDSPIQAAISALVWVVALALLVSVAGLWRRAALVEDEPQIWSLMLLGVAGIVVAALAGRVLQAGIAQLSGRQVEAERAGDLVLGIGCVLACGAFYQALTSWNRSRLGNLDPGEALNGFSAVLVAVALGNLVVPHFRDTGPGLPLWQLQASLWVVAALLVVLGTAAAIAMIAGLFRDPRIWLVIAAITAVASAEITTIAVSEAARPVLEPVWLLAASLIALAVVLPPRTGGTPTPTAAGQATILGALVVLVAGVAILAVDQDLAVDESRLPMVYALAGIVGASVRVVSLVDDLALLSKSRYEAMTDELTGIANRRALLLAIEQALLTPGTSSLLIIDLDRFKAINDRYGHEAGDRVLRHMAETFQELMPPGAILARLGGDEFAVLLDDAEPEIPADLARQLARAAAPLSDVKGRLLQVGASVGVATVRTPGVDGGELLRQADAAMYQAKVSGSGVGIYDGVLDAIAQERLGLVEDLHRALRGSAVEREQIVVYFQPQLETATGRVTGAEALVRWQHPRLGLLAPDSFIELAEQNELMASLTERVMREATLQAVRWHQAGFRLRVSVNLSASCLNHPTLLPLIDEVLVAGLAADDLVLEVTETSLMTDTLLALAALKRLADRGVGISIDDYGTGYSSLSYLNDLPAAELKIDRSFTARVTDDPRTVAIVAGTVELAHRLGMRLIAEGVEDEQTLTVMTRLGCDETQGYLHSRPLPAEAFLAWLTARAAGTAPLEQDQRVLPALG